MPIDRSINKWKFMIALAHIDNRLLRVEKEYLREKITEQAHEAIQESLLRYLEESTLKRPAVDFDKFSIKTPEDKVDTLYLAHELFWVDNHLDDREKAALDEIMTWIRKDKDALLLLKETLPEWNKDLGERCLRSHIEEVFNG